MREALKNAVQSAILFECQLPHQESGLGKSCLSSQNDICFNNTDPQEIAKVIYNGIVEFALNEYEINYDDLEREQRRAILSRIRYNPTADNSAKLKYGFYGEVLLDLILRVFLQTSVVAARGYFYSPIENSEAKGFDAFHLLERDGNIDLWFGEAKFYLRYKDAITPVMEKLGTSLSDGYLNRNLGPFTRNYTQTVKRAADNKRRYAPGEGSIPPVLLSGVSKGACPLAHDFARKV